MTSLIDAPASRADSPATPSAPSTPSPTFADLGLPTPITDELARRGIASPFPIQAAVIPDVLAGRDVAGRAPTGSGKTLGFGLPIVARLGDAAKRRPTALVLAPTRELAEQIMGELTPYVRSVGHRAVAVYGGVGYGKQVSALAAGAELLVACPGRLEDLLESDSVDLSDVDTVVIDEADQMADMGFLPAVRRIVDRTRADRQVLLFSATLHGPVGDLVAEYQDDPIRHEVGDAGPDLESAHHLFWVFDRAERNGHAASVIALAGPTIVFVRTRHGADRIARQLGKLGVRAEAIHGGRNQKQRDRALAAFKDGSADALVATDVAARGIHVDGVSAVIHYDPPGDGDTYHHRSGRTARAGASGVVVSFADGGTRKQVKTVMREIGLRADITPPALDELELHLLLERESDRPATPTADHDAPQAGERRPSRPGGAEDGTVKFFNAARGYGFIRRDGGGDDLFVHYTNIATDGFKSLDNAARVSFVVRPGRRGPEAFDVTVN